jgi:hypothetical protein
VGPERQPHCPDGAQTASIAFRQWLPPPCPRPQLRHCRFPPTVSAATPPSPTALCGFKRSAPPKELLLSFFFFHSCPTSAPPCAVPTPTTVPPLPELHSRAPPLHCQAGQASVAYFMRRRLEPQPQLLLPSRWTPLTVKLHQLPFRSIDATPTTARVSTTILNREPLTTTIGHRPSPPFPSGRATRPVETAPPVSPPLRCATSRFPTAPCSPRTLPRPTLPLVAAGIGRPPPP